MNIQEIYNEIVKIARKRNWLNINEPHSKIFTHSRDEKLINIERFEIEKYNKLLKNKTYNRDELDDYLLEAIRHDCPHLKGTKIDIIDIIGSLNTDDEYNKSYIL